MQEYSRMLIEQYCMTHRKRVNSYGILLNFFTAWNDMEHIYQTYHI